MSISADVFLRESFTAEAHASGGTVWLRLEPSDTEVGHVSLFLGNLAGTDQRGDALRQLRSLADAILEARRLLGDNLEPTPGPDDPTDEPTDEPMSEAEAVAVLAESGILGAELPAPEAEHHCEAPCTTAFVGLAEGEHDYSWQDENGAGHCSHCESHVVTGRVLADARDERPARPLSSVVCLYCGHANGHPPVQGEGCGACNLTSPLGACHGVGALADAAYRAMAARIAPESPTELAAANGDR